MDNIPQPADPPSAPAATTARFRLIVQPEVALSAPSQAALPLSAVQDEILERMREYCRREQVESPLLLRIPPGTGKTYTAVAVAQEEVAAGRSVLWAAPRRNSMDDVRGMPHYQAGLWYEWLAVTGIDPETGQPVCRYSAEQARRTAAGYPVRSLCTQLCWNYRARCPYLNQSRRAAGKIVAARHEHLVRGVSLPRFDLVVVDELPMKAFVQERRIAPEQLPIPATAPALQDLAGQLARLIADSARRPERRIAGRALLSELEQVLGRLFAGGRPAGLDSQTVLSPPPFDPLLPACWLEDALKLLERERQLYESGQKAWAERIWVSPAGLHLLLRHPISGQLPGRCLILDATGDAEIYTPLFGKKPEVFTARVERSGRIYQYVRRTNGKGRLVGKGSQQADTRDTLELIELVRDLIELHGYRRPAILCHLDTRDRWRREFPEATLMHFGALRGSNAAIDCDVLFAAGVSSPNARQIINHAVALDETRTEPFGQIDRQGKLCGIWDHRVRPYLLTDLGLERLRREHGQEAGSAARMVGGYVDPVLDAICRQFREAELVHGIHRARLVRRDCTVWLLTAVPLPEPVDWITEDLPTCPRGMSRKSWLELREWLELRHERSLPVRLGEIAAVAGVTTGAVRKGGWLQAIADFQPGRWQVGEIHQNGKGRPSGALFPRPGGNNDTGVK